MLPASERKSAGAVRSSVSLWLLKRDRPIPAGVTTWRPMPAWAWTLIAIAAVMVTAGVVTTWPWIVAEQARAGADRAAALLDAVRTGLAAGGSAGAAVGLMLAFRRQHHQEIATALAYSDAAERRITDLYSKAAELLGGDNAASRLAGLYALERLGQRPWCGRRWSLLSPAGIGVPCRSSAEPEAASPLSRASDGLVPALSRRTDRLGREQDQAFGWPARFSLRS